MKSTTILILLLLSPGARAADACPAPSESEQVAKIGGLPKTQCERDLTKLREIHGLMRNMTAEEGVSYLATIGRELCARKAVLPPPPAPCSPVHLALEQRCGDTEGAKKSCRDLGRDTTMAQ